MENILLKGLKINNIMRTFFLITALLVIVLSCRGQENKNFLWGTWEETSRSYVNFKDNSASDFTEKEKIIYKGSKIVFTKDTLYGFATYLLENTLKSIKYEQINLKTDTLNWEGDLDDILKQKGRSCIQCILKVPKDNGYKKYNDEYLFYIFEDKTIALLSDYSIHFFKKISNDNIAKWEVNEYGQSIIRSFEYALFSIPIKKNSKHIIITFIPQGIEVNNFKIKKDDGEKGQQFLTLFQINSTKKYETNICEFKIDSSWKNLFFSVGDPQNSINKYWEIRYKFVEKTGKIILNKSFIYTQDFQTTQMYLLKNDEVEILEEKGEWLKVRFYGKKTIEGLIKKSDVGN